MITAATKPPADRGSWLTVKQLAGVFGITAQGFRASYLPEIAADDIRHGKGSKPTTIYAPAAVALYVERELRRAGRGADDDPMTVGGAGSPELEKWRRVRRQREEVELLARLGELEPRAVLWELTKEIADRVRQFAERQIKAHGQDVLDDWLEVVATIRPIEHRFTPAGTRRRELLVYVEDRGEPITVPLDRVGDDHNAND